MTVDHSLTYKKKNPKNVLHKGRLKKILETLDGIPLIKTLDSHLDVGCSNGYITNIISEKFTFKTIKAVDHNKENLQIGRERFSHIRFEYINLNKPNFDQSEHFQFITCFETLEHVGDLETAIKVILSHADKNKSLAVFTVPIEIGFIGTVKFLLKMMYGYKLNMLGNKVSHWAYFKDLLAGNNISKYREKRDGWKTHFGFDYREIDRILEENNFSYKAMNYLSTRFFFIEFGSNAK